MDDAKKNPGACNTEALEINTPSKHVETDNTSDQHSKQENRVDHDILHKICNRCGETKSTAYFSRNTKTADGYLNSCLSCSRPKNAVNRSLRSAINGKCKSCIYDPIAGGGSWKQQVASCTSPSCELFDVRPISGGVS